MGDRHKRDVTTERPSDAVYRDAARPVGDRVEDLLDRMKLEEKIGQLNAPILVPPELAEFAEQTGVSDLPISHEDVERFTGGTHEADIGPGGGFFGLASEKLPEGSLRQAGYHNALQSIAVGQTRLGIPLLQIVEGTHGVMASGATVFPEGINLGSTWNPDLVRDVFAAAAREARAVGIHALATLVVDPIRDPRMGRGCEGFSEDPYLVSRLAQAVVQGTQGEDLTSDDKVVAVLTHFLGQTQPVGGLERGAVEVSERVLREVFLPPFVAGVRENGALSVMATYPAVDGVPAHASERLLTRLLRDELGFDGVVLSEGGGFGTLIYEGVAGTQKEAGVLGLRAGVDVNISYEAAYLKPLIESVEEGLVPEELVDRAVRRILALKFRLGLFENPFVDEDRAGIVVHAPEHRELALQAARESIVLLKNESSLLPLSKDIRSVAVIGPNAEAPVSQLGQKTVGEVLQPVSTVLDGVRGKVGTSTTVTHVGGCEVLGEDRSGFDDAVKAARDADVAVVVVGEQGGAFWDFGEEGAQPTVGEGLDAVDLDLTGVQEALIKAIRETGTPTVVVLINGRPLSVRWAAESAPAIVEAWLPGERGGEAAADVLFGDHNPSGRLPVTIPRHVGQIPASYDYKPSKAYWIETSGTGGYVKMPATPLYEFGFGLSYTTFEYSDLAIEPQKILPDGEARASVRVTNTGAVTGQEVVQLYVNDVISSVTTSVKRLRGFEKVALEPGETRTVEFALSPEDLSLLDADLMKVVEPGEFEVMVGASSEDVRLRGRLDVVDR